jgi:hypothetical protein
MEISANNNNNNNIKSNVKITNKSGLRTSNSNSNSSKRPQSHETILEECKNSLDELIKESVWRPYRAHHSTPNQPISRQSSDTKEEDNRSDSKVAKCLAYSSTKNERVESRKSADAALSFRTSCNLTSFLAKQSFKNDPCEYDSASQSQANSLITLRNQSFFWGYSNANANAQESDQIGLQTPKSEIDSNFSSSKKCEFYLYKDKCCMIKLR